MKEASITFKTSPEVKRALEDLAKQGFRSLSSQVEMIVVTFLEEKGSRSKQKPKREAQ